jgi:hypothetical protein
MKVLPTSRALRRSSSAQALPAASLLPLVSADHFSYRAFLTSSCSRWAAMWRASAFVPAHPAGSMLSTHLPIHEIAAEMVLSSHTVRTQGKSIYRKPGAASHS